MTEPEPFLGPGFYRQKMLHIYAWLRLTSFLALYLSGATQCRLNAPIAWPVVGLLTFDFLHSVSTLNLPSSRYQLFDDTDHMEAA